MFLFLYGYILLRLGSRHYNFVCISFWWTKHQIWNYFVLLHVHVPLSVTLLTHSDQRLETSNVVQLLPSILAVLLQLVNDPQNETSTLNSTEAIQRKNIYRELKIINISRRVHKNYSTVNSSYCIHFNYSHYI
jgi:hypothetical protein